MLKSFQVELAILKVSDGLCFYCSGLANQADHVVPIAMGGSDDPSNLVPSCGPCNSSKGKNRLSAKDEALALDCAAELVERIKSLGWKTYGSRAAVHASGSRTVVVRVSPEMIAGLNRIRRDESDIPSQSEMIRRIIRRAGEALADAS